MFFTTSNLVHYLLSRGFLLNSDVVNSRLVICDVSRRNRNFKVMINENRGLFVKQIQATNELSMKTMQREIDCYQLTREFPKWSALMPALIDHDAVRRSLVVELFPRAENLREYHVRVSALPIDVARLLGTVIGQFHRSMPLTDLTRSQLDFFRRKPCWILSFKEAPESASGGVKQLLRFLHQSPALLERMDRLSSNWRFDHVIHGDLKWDNCLVFPDAMGNAQAKLIDWELVDVGDAAWDVGGILQSYFVYWIGFQRSKQTSIDQIVLLDVFLESTQLVNALRAFWEAYVDAFNLVRSDQHIQLLRCIEYAAARLMLTVYESSWNSDQLSEDSILMLRLSEMMLMSPESFGDKIHNGEESAKP